jgi:hypothetical protein
MVDPLSKRLDLERITKNLHGITVVKGTKKINHSQFVDDTLLMRGALTMIVEQFKLALDQFMNVSSGQINKGHDYGWNTSPRHCNP